jgi:Kef-type K+ transport system membrane component KefB
MRDNFAKNGWGAGLVLLAVGLVTWAAALLGLYALFTWVPARVVAALIGSIGISFVAVSVTEDILLDLRLKKMEKKNGSV